MSKMIDCPHCGHNETHVYLAKKTEEGGYRRHECKGCGKRFTTLQYVASKDGYKKRVMRNVA